MTGEQFMGNNNASPNVIPACPSPTGGACLDPAALNTVKLFPQPNVSASLGDLFLYNPVNRNDQDLHSTFASITRSTPTQFFSVSFSYGNVRDHNPDPLFGKRRGRFIYGRNPQQGAAALLTVVLVATKINEFKIGYSRYVVDAVPVLQDSRRRPS